METKKSQIKKLDKLWAEIIKARAEYKCEKCGRTGRLNAHHIFSRGSKGVRYSLSNGVNLCVLCHVFGQDSAHKNPLDFFDWLYKYRGKKEIEGLRVQSKIPVKPDYKLIEIYLKEELKRYKA